MFRVITLSEPPKNEMIKFLEKIRVSPRPSIRPTRVAMVQFYAGKVKERKTFKQVKVDLRTRIVFDEQDLTGRHSHIDTAYMHAVEVACLADTRVQAEIQACELPEGATVVVEPWAYAPDGMNDMKERISMV